MTEKIERYHLEDMESYNPNYKAEDWADKTAEEFMAWYKDNKVKLDVTTWRRLNDCKDTLLWKNEFRKQICFTRDDIGELFFHSYYIPGDSWNVVDEKMRIFNASLRKNVTVSGEHMSKSILLPQYLINAFGNGELSIRIAHNFYSYAVSIDSKYPIHVPFMGLFDTSKCYTHMSGFKDDQVYGSYDSCNTKFSFEIGDVYKFYTVMYLIADFWKTRYEKLNPFLEERK